ncbi:uncharacterized protein LOC130258911 [Oenanthe melanoleuca]|uniref:uncharacterized protein LOC130258911 n=1 Tax=Oenanthe melanoleuca TaxID=2939378 RepID=UPI0024C1CCE0|nr:uncharacterized protein LOC130258911 [Oenanthe melanoleuca]
MYPGGKGWGLERPHRAWPKALGPFGPEEAEVRACQGCSSSREAALVSAPWNSDRTWGTPGAVSGAVHVGYQGKVLPTECAEHCPGNAPQGRCGSDSEVTLGGRAVRGRPQERFRGGVRRLCRSLGGRFEGVVGAAAAPSAGGRDALALCPELERSLSLLEPGGGRAEQQQQESGGRARPTVFVCTGCRRPVGTPRAGRSNTRRAAASCCAVSAGPATRRVPAVTAAIPPSLRLRPQRRRGPGAEGLRAPQRVRMHGRNLILLWPLKDTWQHLQVYLKAS